MKQIIITGVKEYDRNIFYIKEDNKIIHIDYLQGLGGYGDDYQLIQEFIRQQQQNEIINIYNRLLQNEKYIENNVKYFDEVNKINYAIELYEIAYNNQYIQYY